MMENVQLSRRLDYARRELEATFDELVAEIEELESDKAEMAKEIEKLEKQIAEWED